MENSHDFSRECRTPREHKIDALLRVFHGEQKQAGEFRHKNEWRESIMRIKPDVTNQDIEEIVKKSLSYSRSKEAMIKENDARDYEGAEMRKYESVLEALIHYSGTQGTLYHSTKIAELGSDYDDKKSGVDVLIGLKDETVGTQIFSLDACSAGNKQTIARKFEKSRQANNRAYRPLCNEIRYCYYSEQDPQEGRKEHYRFVPMAPNYIVGASKQTICQELDEQLQLEGSISYEFVNGTVSNDFCKKILTEIYFQSRTGYLMANNFINEHPEETPKAQVLTAKVAKKQHKTVADATRSNLYRLFGIDKNAEDASAKLDSAIFEFAQAKSQDETYSTIFQISANEWTNARKESQRIKNQKAQAIAQKASSIADALSA